MSKKLNETVNTWGLPEESKKSIADQYGGVWGEHPDFSVNDWKYEVSNDDTRQGYWDWVENQLEANESQANKDSIRPEIVKWYVDKFGQKMRGSSMVDAKAWVDPGTGTATNAAEKAEIWKQIKNRYYSGTK